MNQIKTLTIKKEKVVSLIQFTGLMEIAIAASLFHNQLITGSIVNAILFISVVFLGVRGAILIGSIPSLIALSSGLLPLVLAPMIPFIIIGNAVLIIVFGYFKERNYWLGAVLASTLKFLFLFSTSSIVVNLLLKKEVATKVAMMMSWPQLSTALAGALIAYLVLKSIKKID